MTQVSVPVSVGELVDKVTILRIKQKNISDAAKLGHIERELQLLTSVCGEAGIDLAMDEVTALEEVNGKLWKIEDDIREKERRKEFDEGFVALARAVYVTNDERFKLKSQVNERTGSALREEKSYKEY